MAVEVVPVHERSDVIGYTEERAGSVGLLAHGDGKQRTNSGRLLLWRERNYRYTFLSEGKYFSVMIKCNLFLKMIQEKCICNYI